MVIRRMRVRSSTAIGRRPGRPVRRERRRQYLRQPCRCQRSTVSGFTTRSEVCQPLNHLGECAQIDWGSFGTVAVGNTRRRLSFFIIVLAYSRLTYVEFTVSQTMDHFLSCHEHAFAAFGGVPTKIMVDNLKSAVLQRLAGVAPVCNP